MHKKTKMKTLVLLPSQNLNHLIYHNKNINSINSSIGYVHIQKISSIRNSVIFSR